MIEPEDTCRRDTVFAETASQLVQIDVQENCAILHPDGHEISYNLDDWATGDILLTGPDDQDVGIDVITGYQKRIDANINHHRWWHVGIFDGISNIYEALPEQHVIQTPVSVWAAEKPVIHRVRAKAMTIHQRDFDAAVQSLKSEAYEVTRHVSTLLVARAVRTGVRLPAMKRNYDGQALICSVFVERVLRHVTQKEIFKSIEIALPLDFAASGDFVSMPTVWRRC